MSGAAANERGLGAMSMEQLTVLQWLAAFFAYAGLTIALPALVLYPKVKDCRAVTRFFFYFSVGNFYLINVVYALQILHISYRITLVAAMLLPAAVCYLKIRRIPVREAFTHHREQLGRVIRGSFGVKNWLRRMRRQFTAGLCKCIKFAAKSVGTHFLDCVFLVLVSAVVLGFYGPELTAGFGYAMSDIPVHNYWINHMGQNDIFVGGVYPFGFHNIVYFIHTVFGLDTFALLRVFWLIQVYWLHMILLMFLKGVCKSRFIPYFGPVVFAVGGFYSETYKRYYASLPQEFGMLYILPAVYFAFEFFRIKKEEITGRREEPVSKYYLMGFAMNFAMTFSVHFYGTIILGIFCVGIACGYFVRFLRPKYFGKVVKTCFLGLFVAVLPLAVAYATGTRLEGSLRWAMSVMMPAQEDAEPLSHSRYEFDENGKPIGAPIVRMEDGKLAYMDELTDGAVVYYPIDSDDMTEEEKDAVVEKGYTGDEPPAVEPPEEEKPQKPKRTLEDVKKQARWVFDQIDQMVRLYEFNEYSKSMCDLIYLALLVCFVMAPLFLVAQKFDYAFMLVSVAVYNIFLMFLLCMSNLGLPQLMDASRSSIYLAYAIPILWIVAMDAIVYFLLGMWKWRVMRGVMNAASLAACFVCAALLVRTGMYKRPYVVDHFQTNGAVTCLTNIICDNSDFTWTIVSANDETRMGEDHGYHYELITFLQDMEFTGGISTLTLPTRMAYFFVEKVPIDYSVPYENSGQPISQEGAARPLPDKSGIGAYMAEDRWILMSRMYEWAQTFKSMYPNEMRVYYEDDEFICYALEQNDYHLYNLSIDYGYNMR